MSIGGNWDRRVSRRSFLGAGGLGAAALLFGSGEVLAQQSGGRAGYGPTQPDLKGMLDLPEGFMYRVISREGQELSDGTPVPGDHDGMVAIAGRGDNTILVRNHELRTADANPLEGRNPYDSTQVGGTTAVVVGPDRRVIRSYVSSSGSVNNCGRGHPLGHLADLRGGPNDHGRAGARVRFRGRPEGPRKRPVQNPNKGDGPVLA